jgi:hypothetical protein
LARIAFGESASAFLQSAASTHAGNHDNSPAASTESARGIRAKWLAPRAVDVVALGLVVSLSRPGGNVTGVTSLNTEVVAKRLGIVRELLPQASHYFALVNPSSALADPFIRDLEVGASSLGLAASRLPARFRARASGCEIFTTFGTGADIDDMDPVGVE